LAEERDLPRFARRMSLRVAPAAPRGNLLDTGSQDEKQEIASSLRSSQRHVVIFLPDVFSRYIEPQVEEAALEVLTLCGYDVRVLPIVGAGASLLSKGFVDAAKRHARRMLKLLNQLDPRREAFIVGVEPPEVYLLKNDFVDLLPERGEEIRARAKRVWLLDEFLLRSREFESVRVGRLGDTKQDHGDKLYFHPHCHQRAEGPSADGVASGANASVELLRTCGFDVELSDAGCCGMAGTFGYEAEHYEVSMRVGEFRLMPKIRETILDTRESEVGTSNIEYRKPNIVSSGAACRMQVRHGTGLAARSTIEWVREALVNGE